MRILVLHAWLKGNLGDVLQLTVLLSALRELEPRVLDLAGFPARPAPETEEVLKLVDRFVPDPFPWYWHFAPAPIGRALFDPWWRKQRQALFSRYDAVVCAPGPYLADYDPRVTSALSDISIATELGIAVVLSSHSIGPLKAARLATVAKATVCIAREPVTYRYLTAHDIPVVLSADLAFLYPYRKLTPIRTLEAPYRLAFLRSNSLTLRDLRLEDGALFAGSRMILRASDEPLVLATSDRRRDERFLARAARRLGVRWVACRSVPELVQLIDGSASVVSDRYHPAICAATLGRPAQVLSNREPHKMDGLIDLLAGSTVAELQELARTGLRALRDVLRRET